MTSYVYMSLWLDQRSHGKVERSIPARPGIVFTLRIQLDCKHSCYRWQLTWVPKLMDCEPRVWRKERNQTITSFNTELVVVWIGAGCGLDPGLDRSGSGSGSAQKWTHMRVYVAAWMQHDKKRTTRCASSKCTAWLLARLALQLATVSALQFDSLDAQQLQLGCLTAWQRGFTTVCCLAAWQGE